MKAQWMWDTTVSHGVNCSIYFIIHSNFNFTSLHWKKRPIQKVTFLWRDAVKHYTRKIYFFTFHILLVFSLVHIPIESKKKDNFYVGWDVGCLFPINSKCSKLGEKSRVTSFYYEEYPFSSPTVIFSLYCKYKDETDIYSNYIVYKFIEIFHF